MLLPSPIMRMMLIESRRPLPLLHLDRLGPFAGFGDVIDILHPHERVHRNELRNYGDRITVTVHLIMKKKAELR